MNQSLERIATYVPVSQELLDDYRHEYVQARLSDLDPRLGDGLSWICKYCGSSPEHWWHT